MAGQPRWADLRLDVAGDHLQRPGMDDDAPVPEPGPGFARVRRGLGVVASRVPEVLVGLRCRQPVHGGPSMWRAGNAPEHSIDGERHARGPVSLDAQTVLQAVALRAGAGPGVV